MNVVNTTFSIMNKNLFKNKQSFRSKTFNTTPTFLMPPASEEHISSTRKRLNRRIPSIVINEEPIFSSDDEQLTTSTAPLSPNIPTKDEIEEAHAYVAPCERRISVKDKIYLINDCLPKISTTMSKVEFGVRSCDFTPLAFKTVFSKEDADREIKFLDKVKGLEHVVQLLDTFLDLKGNTVLVLPVLRPFNAYRLDLIDIAKYTKQLITALDGIHKRNIVHMDVTPANLMVDENGDLVLIDFGLSTFIDGSVMCPSCGTPGYIAPEVFDNRSICTPKIDIYSAGIVIGSMLEPYISRCDLQYLGGNLVRSSTTEKIVSHLESYLSHSPSTTTFYQGQSQSTTSVHYPTSDTPAVVYKAASLLKDMLATNPESRPTTSDILEHKFVVAYNQRKKIIPDPFLYSDYKTCEERKRLTAYREYQWHSMEDSDDDHYYSYLS